jgi:hypothetical protein
MPYLISAANVSPPVEIMVLDYNSQDDLAEYMKHTMSEAKLTGGSTLSYRKYTGRDYYHMAHARNLSVLASKGEFVIVFCADIILSDNYFKIVRDTLSEDDYVWLRHNDRFVGVIGCKREEFIESGGFDERFEFYGKEDKDIILRLTRRGGKFKQLPNGLLTLIPTPRTEKFKHYRLNLPRSEISRRSKRIYEDNINNEATVVNVDGWGNWG